MRLGLTRVVQEELEKIQNRAARCESSNTVWLVTTTLKLEVWLAFFNS